MGLKARLGKSMPIRDNRDLKDLDNLSKTFERVAWLAPVASLFGGRGREIARHLEDARRTARRAREMVTVPDRFNAAFLIGGWISSEVLKFDAMEEAVLLAESGDVDRGDALLVDAHDSDWLLFVLQRLRAVRAFLPRRRILERALEDHRAERYHASVPVVLAQIDGLVFDVAQASFYDSRRADRLYAANTLAGHPDGLTALSKVMGKSRSRTTTSILSLPYRHGILHGRDLGYATKDLSTKAFCALGALREWALPVERGTAKLEPPLEWIDPDEATRDDVKTAWRDLMVQLRRVSEDRSH
jgi:hypothetical protein